jgi:heme/copper-type cytochrome/quinol oxidase subunit 1
VGDRPGDFLRGVSLGAFNFITTTLDLRTKGMTFGRMPLTVWAWLITAILGVAGLRRVAGGLHFCCSIAWPERASSFRAAWS